MKLLTLPIFGVIIFFGILSASFFFTEQKDFQMEDTHEKISNFITFENKAWGFKIDHPENWTVREEENLLGLRFFPEGTSNSEIAKNPNLLVLVMPLDDENRNLDEYVKNKMNHLPNNFMIDEFQYDIKEEKLGDVKVIRSDITRHILGEDIRSTEYYMHGHGRLYMIAFGTHPTEHEENIEIANRMISSFRFI